jgi:acetyl esterase/lipase
MNSKTYVPPLAVVACLMVGGTSAQQPPQGSEAARNAYPIPTTVRVARDLVYAAYGNRRLRLDIYRPAESSQRKAAPGVLVVRGGGWRSGDKEAFGFIAGNLAKEGFVAASIEYRTSAEAKFPAAVHDVKAAVRWIRANAATYGVDPDAIGAIGGSAGAHLVAMLATSAGVKDLEGAGGNVATSSQVQAVVAMACVCNMELRGAAVTEFIGAPLESRSDTIKAASPITYVSRRSAPLLLLHSRTDPVVPFAQSAEIEELYRRASAAVSLKEINAPATHAFWNETRYFAETMKLAVEFFRLNLVRVN